MHPEVFHMRPPIHLTVSIVIPMSPMQMPRMTTPVRCIEVRSSEVEIVTVRIAHVHPEVPVPGIPVQWAVEIARCDIRVPLPVEQDIAQVQVSALPVGTVHVRPTRHTHQVVQVDLVGSLILLVGQVQFVRHLVRQEQRLASCLLVAHGLGRDGHHHHHGHHHQSVGSRHHLLHILILLFI